MIRELLHFLLAALNNHHLRPIFFWSFFTRHWLFFDCSQEIYSFLHIHSWLVFGAKFYVLSVKAGIVKMIYFPCFGVLDQDPS